MAVDDKPLGREISLTAGAGIEIYGHSADVVWVQNNGVDSKNASDTIVFSSEFAFYLVHSKILKLRRFSA